MEATTSYHGYMRAQERISGNVKDVGATIEKAWVRGKHIEDYSGYMLKYLKGLVRYCSPDQRKEFRIYGNNVYIFGVEAEPFLITVLPISQNALRKSSKSKYYEAEE